MEKIELTKNTIKKFYNTPIEVNLWNGCFNKAEVNIKNNHKAYRWCGNPLPLLCSLWC